MLVSGWFILEGGPCHFLWDTYCSGSPSTRSRLPTSLASGSVLLPANCWCLSISERRLPSGRDDFYSVRTEKSAMSTFTEIRHSSLGKLARRILHAIFRIRHRDGSPVTYRLADDVEIQLYPEGEVAEFLMVG